MHTKIHSLESGVCNFASKCCLLSFQFVSVSLEFPCTGHPWLLASIEHRWFQFSKHSPLSLAWRIHPKMKLLFFEPQTGIKKDDLNGCDGNKCQNHLPTHISYECLVWSFKPD